MCKSLALSERCFCDCDRFIVLQLAYLPHKRRDLILEDENIDLYIAHDGNAENPDDTLKEEKKSRKNGLLNWLKIRVGIDLEWKIPALLFVNLNF